MRIMMVVNLALFLVLLLFGVSVFTPRNGAVRRPRFGARGSGARGAMIMQGSASAGKIYSFRVIE